MRHHAVVRYAITVVASIIVATSLGGCQQGLAGHSDATPTSTPGFVNRFDPQGSALDNKPVFDKAILTAAQQKDEHVGKNLVNALVHAGFAKTALQVTFDKSKTGQVADSVIVSVEIGTSCLIGQRAQDGSVFSSVEPALASGGCLIGITRQIDW